MISRNIVCVVDDDPSIRSALCSLFRSLGYGTIAFDSGGDFLAWVPYHDAACVISDVQMPDVSGVEMYLQMRATGKHIPTILVTAYPTPELQSTSLKSGVIAYLSKPVNIPELTALVESVVCRPR